MSERFWLYLTTEIKSCKNQTAKIQHAVTLGGNYTKKSQSKMDACFYCSLLHDKSKGEYGNIHATCFPSNILNCWDKYMKTRTVYTCSICNAYTTCVKSWRHWSNWMMIFSFNEFGNTIKKIL